MEEEMTIADIVAGNDDFTLLGLALETAGLTEAVADPEATLTVFAPTDAAFTAAATTFGFEGDVTDEDAVFAFLVEVLTDLSGGGDPVPLLTSILTYHVVAEDLSLEEVNASVALETLESTLVIPVGDSLIDAAPESVDPAFIEGLTDIDASNGTIHAIDGVLLPIDLDLVTPEADLVDLLVSVSSDEGFDDDTSDFDVLIAAVSAADLVGALTDPEADLTVVAPTDQAFIDLATALGAEVADESEAFTAIVAALSSLSEGGDPIPLLTDILTYHVFTESLSRVEIAESETIETVFGPGPTPGARTLGDEEPSLPDAAFIDAASDLVASNGIAHAIDAVLLPIALPGEEDPANLVGTEGDDDFEVTPVVESIDGLAGFDSVAFGAALGEVAVTPAEGGFTATLGEQVVDLTSIEQLVFADETAELTEDPTALSVARLYDNGLGGIADIAGLSFWTTVADIDGLEAVADAFADTVAFQGLYGTVEDGAAFVEELYTGILGRVADEDGLAFWTDAIDDGLGDGDLLFFFSESAEAVEADAGLTDDGVFLLA